MRSTTTEKTAAPKMYNRTEWDISEIVQFPLLGNCQNNWRQRRIRMYQHPTDTNKIVTVGTHFSGSEVIVVTEDKSAYSHALTAAENGKVYCYQ